MMDITVTFPGGKRVDAQLGAHVVHTDQPVSNGGEDSAPSPFNTFLAALATCAGIYVVGFCKARNIPTDNIRLVQHHEYGPDGHHLTRVRIEVQVPPEFPEKYRAAVQRVAEQCAVKKAILEPPAFEIATVVSGA